MTKINVALRVGLENSVQCKFQDGIYVLYYLTEEIETVTKDILKYLSETIDHDKITFITNAGVDIHSTEDDIIYGIRVHKARYDDMVDMTNALND
tara:strand:- start:131 stop:415 length:285 start_codon:yes stop_codon:yes gene_type:complete